MEKTLELPDIAAVLQKMRSYRQNSTLLWSAYQDVQKLALDMLDALAKEAAARKVSGNLRTSGEFFLMYLNTDHLFSSLQGALSIIPRDPQKGHKSMFYIGPLEKGLMRGNSPAMLLFQDPDEKTGDPTMCMLGDPKEGFFENAIVASIDRVAAICFAPKISAEMKAITPYELLLMKRASSQKILGQASESNQVCLVEKFYALL